MSRKTEVVVNVTESHIKRGISGDPNSCPIALALLSKKYRNVEVGEGTIGFTNRSNRYVIVNTPKKATTFINRFDGGANVKTFSFKISY